MLAPDHIRTLRRDDLRGWVAERQRPIAALTASNEALRAEFDQLKRGGKRQAAPFSKDTRVAEPKPPGRTPGAGTFRYRESPPPETSTEPPVDVRVWREACPVGGGPLTEERVEFASRTELRARPRPQVTRDRGWVCRGTGGGQPVRGEHPDGAPAQYGATAPRLGPRGMAAAQAWPEGVGLPVRKVPRVMAMGPGVQLTPGALPQAALRRAAGPLGIADEQGRAVVREAPVVPTDDTGWRVGGPPAPVRAWETEAATVYHIRPRQRPQEGQEGIPADAAGVRGTDCGRRDAAQACDRVDQPQGLAHRLRSRHAVVERKRGRAREVGASRKTMLREARARGHRHREEPVADGKVDAEALQAERTSQRRERRLQDLDNPRWRTDLGGHHDRGHLRRFGGEPRIEPTPRRAERALRPALLARQVSHGSKNGAGAYAVAAITRGVRTLAQQGGDALRENRYQLFRGPDVHATPP